MSQESKPKIRLILKDSEYADSGLVLDSLGTVPLEVTKDYEPIGTWQRLRCGIVVELTTTIEARQDILVNLLKSVSMHRSDSGTSVLPLHERESKISDYKVPYRSTQSKHARTRTTRPQPQPNQFDGKFEELRRKLRGQ